MADQDGKSVADRMFERTQIKPLPQERTGRGTVPKARPPKNTTYSADASGGLYNAMEKSRK